MMQENDKSIKYFSKSIGGLSGNHDKAVVGSCKLKIFFLATDNKTYYETVNFLICDESVKIPGILLSNSFSKRTNTNISTKTTTYTRTLFDVETHEKKEVELYMQLHNSEPEGLPLPTLPDKFFCWRLLDFGSSFIRREKVGTSSRSAGLVASK